VRTILTTSPWQSRRAKESQAAREIAMPESVATD